MASVYKAHEPSLDRHVALKVMPPEFMHDPTFAERFRREAQTIAKLEHPHIIPIYAYDIDQEQRIPWMAMRMIAGGTLSGRLKEGKLPAKEAVRVMRAVAEALDYAHRAGVIHRDVKPQNVLMEKDGPVYLADFGIAKIVEGNSQLTATGMITGTPQYMAPEQALGKPLTGAADIYALGIMTYELFTGRVPFSADTPVAVLMKQASEPMPSPKPGEAPEAITRVIMKATAKEPSERYATAADFAHAISMASLDAGPAGRAAVLDSMAATVVTPAPAVQQRVSPSAVAPEQRHSNAKAFVAIAAVALLGLGSLGGAAMWWRSRSSANVEAQTALVPIAATSDNLPGSGGMTAQIPEPVQTPAALPTVTPDSGTNPVAPAEVTPSNTASRPQPAETRTVTATKQLSAPAQSMGQPSAPVRPDRGGDQGTAPPMDRPDRPTAAVAKSSHVVLDIEAVQSSTGSQISALFLEIAIDGRVLRQVPIRFMGASPFQRWRRREKVDLGEIPVTARELQIAMATDRSMDSDRLEKATGLELSAGEDKVIPVQVRFVTEFDRTIRFREHLIDDEERAREREKN